MLFGHWTIPTYVSRFRCSPSAFTPAASMPTLVVKPGEPWPGNAPPPHLPLQSFIFKGVLAQKSAQKSSSHRSGCIHVFDARPCLFCVCGVRPHLGQLRDSRDSCSPKHVPFETLRCAGDDGNERAIETVVKHFAVGRPLQISYVVDVDGDKMTATLYEGNLGSFLVNMETNVAVTVAYTSPPPPPLGPVTNVGAPSKLKPPHHS